MNRQRAIKRLDIILSEQKRKHRETLNRLHVKYQDKKLCNNSSTTLTPVLHKLNMELAIASSFFDESSNEVKEFDFVEAVIDLYHESYHAMQLVKNPISDDDVDELSSYVSRFYNNETYKNEYHRFSYEIAAERYALIQTRRRLSHWFSGSNLDSILLDYVNAKATDKTSGYKYFISTDTKFTNMNDVFKAFDEAYEKSYIDKKDFSSITDCVGKVLSEDNKLCNHFDNMSDGKEQTRFAASIVLEQHPELYHQQKNLRTIAAYVNDVRNEHQSGHDVSLIDDFDVRL